MHESTFATFHETETHEGFATEIGPSELFTFKSTDGYPLRVAVHEAVEPPYQPVHVHVEELPGEGKLGYAGFPVLLVPQYAPLNPVAYVP